MTQSDDQLGEVRVRIDAIDRQIQELLNLRAEAARQVGEIKRRSAADGVVDFYRPEREAQILREIARRNSGPLPDLNVQRIFREIISASLALEQPMSVAYLGPEGTYSHAATLRHFGHAIVSLPEAGIAEIFHAVENGRARFGVVPVENSTEGTVNQTLDLLMRTSLRICGETNLRIQHRLLSLATPLADVVEVHAHPQSLAQCRQWLDTHLPDAQRIAASSNAVAAEYCRSHHGTAAIAGEAAAELYGLDTLAAGIEDTKNNTTRFLVIGDQDIAPSGNDVTSLLVSAAHRPGGLRRMLLPFEEAGVSLHRIESRPNRNGLWEYVFFIDVSGHQHDSALAPVLVRLAEEVPLVRVLGSYPSAL